MCGNVKKKGRLVGRSLFIFLLQKERNQGESLRQGGQLILLFVCLEKGKGFPYLLFLFFCPFGIKLYHWGWEGIASSFHGFWILLLLRL